MIAATERVHKLTGRVVPRLSKSMVTKYRRMQEMSEESSRLCARLKELDVGRKTLEADLLLAFGKDKMRRISRMVVLHRKEIKVPASEIIRPAYSYTRWREAVEG